MINNSNKLEVNSLPSLDSLGTTSHKTVKLFCGNHGHMRIVKLKCSDRTCPECRNRIYVKLFKGWQELVSGMKHPKMLTLTTKNVFVLKKSDLKALRSYFIRLMRRKYYRDRIIGGLYVIEIKNIGSGWNLHLHALIDTVSGPNGFLVQKKISEDWLAITKTSKIVDIRKVEKPKYALSYILKYLTKSPQTNGQDDVYNEVLKGSRLIQTFGRLYSCKPTKKKLVCKECGCDWWISEFDLPYIDWDSEKSGYQSYRKRYKDDFTARFTI